MKRILFTILLISATVFSYGQTIYYWVGGTAPSTSITIGTNWNTSLDGSGSARPSSTGTSDVLVFDGSNVGGSTPTTGTVAELVNGSVSCAQMKFVNNASVTFVRATTGTSTITVAGDVGEDFVIEAGSSLAFISTSGSIRVAMAAANSGRVSGTLTYNAAAAARIDNTIAGTGIFLFTSGSSLYNNAMPASSYAFGSNTQSSEKWVVFENGSHIYYNGGTSPFGGVSTYSALDLKPGSTWHHRANNPVSGSGSFFSRKSFGNITVENNATLTAEGPIYRINNLVVDAGASFITHSSGQTVVMGNVTVNGSMSSPAAGTNELLLAGNTQQTISGAGTINVSNFIAGDKADVLLSKNIAVETSATLNGKVNFGTNQLTGGGTFTAQGIITALPGTANAIAGTYQLTGNVGIPSTARGKSISGAGIAPNTMIVAFSTTADTIYLSSPLSSSGIGMAISVTTGGATLETANTNGFNPATGSVVFPNLVFEDRINYKINAATVTPFGVSTGSAATTVNTGTVFIAAPVTVNKSVSISQQLTLNGKMILRPLDTLHLLSAASINGTPNASNYIATDYNAVSSAQSIVQYDGMAASTLLPIGTITNYLPVTINPSSASGFSAAVFEGITTNGTITGTPFTALQKQTVVNTVWNINRSSGTGSASVGINWPAALEGSTFTTLPGTDIGLIQNTGALWSLPLGTGDNASNTASANVSSFGAFSAGAIPQVNPFVFNDLPVKAYGDADFTGGATSLNTAQPIVYTSSNAAVATIVGGAIHITGAGNSNITASQASDGFYPAASVTKPLNVNKAALTITADNKTKFEGEVNPPLTITYTGFVLGQTSSVLLTPAVISTTAVTASTPAVYPITVTGASSNNYAISFTNGTLTVVAKQPQTITFAAPAIKNYGNADFAIGASSTNSTIPLLYSSSNTNVATVIGSNIHIVGAGTTNVTVSQAGSVGYFPATDVIRTLTVNKVPLAVKVFDSSRLVGQPNPAFRVTYTGFVLGETAANLTTAPTPVTAATTSSSPGIYPVNLEGGVSQNYNFTYTNARLTVLPSTGTASQYLSAFLNTNGNLSVRVYSPKPLLGDVLVFDMMGRYIARKNLFMPVGFISTELFIPSLQSGTYVVCVKGDGVDLKQIIQIIK